jgi:subtilase family serine protease
MACKVKMEMLEPRLMLSASNPVAPGPLQSQPTPLLGLVGTSNSLDPQLIDDAYDFNGLDYDVSGTITPANGADQTIAIVDAFGSPTIINDVQVFDAETYLVPGESEGAAGTAMSNYDAEGNFFLTVQKLTAPADTLAPASEDTEEDIQGWAKETSLDVEWAHAMAPGAHILLVEAASDSVTDLLDADVYAANVNGVSVVSNSWGFDVGELEAGYYGTSGTVPSLNPFTFDGYLQTPAGHLDNPLAGVNGGVALPGSVTFLASSGDSGDELNFPASSYYAIGVGGETITIAYSTNDANYGYIENTGQWAGSGGDTTYYSSPVYHEPIVAFNANPETGVWIYDSTPDPAEGATIDGGWSVVGGTSVSCPIWASVIAICDQGLQLRGIGSLNTLQTMGLESYDPLRPAQSTTTAYGILGLAQADIYTVGDLNGFYADPGDPNSYPLWPTTGPAPDISLTPAGGNAGYGTPNLNNASSSAGGYWGGFVQDMVGGPTYGTPTQLTIYSDTLDQLTFTEEPGNTTAGQSMTPSLVVTAYLPGTTTVDANFTSDVSITLLGAGTLNGITTKAAAAGVATFSGLYIDTAGTYQLVASASDVNPGESTTFTISPAAAAQLAITEQPVSFLEGSFMATPVVMALEDEYGNTIVGNSGTTVTVSINTGPTGAVLSGNTSTTTVDGVATFNSLSANLLGTYTLIGKTGSITSPVSSSFEVEAPQLAWVDQPTSFVQGSAMTSPIEVEVEDPSGNVVDSNTTIITLSINSGPTGAVLSGQITATTVDGVATFDSVSADLLGNYTLVATTDSVSSPASSAFTVEMPQLAFIDQPTSFVQGSAMATPITVEVEDPSGNLVDTNSTVVTLKIDTGPTGAVLSGQTTATTVDGIATFTAVSANLLGGYTLIASTTSVTSAASTSFQVELPQLAWIDQPTSFVQYSAMTSPIVVDLEDPSGNLVNSSNTVVTLKIDTFSPAPGISGSPVLSGQTTATTVDGVATFNSVSANLLGSYTLIASTSTISSPASSSFTVEASHLAFVEQPTSTWQYAAMPTPVTVAVEDPNGNVSTIFPSVPITLSIASGAAGSVLSSTSGSLTAKTVNGVATFTGLVINNPGSDRLLATSSYSTSGLSDFFAVVAVPAKQYFLFNGTPLGSASVVLETIRLGESFAMPPTNAQAQAVLDEDPQAAVVTGSFDASPAAAAGADPASSLFASGDSTSGSSVDSQLLDSGSGDNNLLD